MLIATAICLCTEPELQLTPVMNLSESCKTPLYRGSSIILEKNLGKTGKRTGNTDGHLGKGKF